MKQNETKQVIKLPALPANKSSRIFTKHYVNIPLYLDHKYYSLLTWLVYQSKVDNTVLYSVQLLRRYSKSILISNQEYGSGDKRSPNGLNINLTAIRANITYLINKGYLISFSPKLLLINPMLVHTQHLNRTQLNRIMQEYQKISSADEKLQVWCKDYVTLVRKKLHLKDQ